MLRTRRRYDNLSCMTDDPKPGDRDLPDDDPDAALPGESTLDESRHYLQDPDGLSASARDEDERDEDDLLEPDQTELVELGLILDDPHQPED